MSTWSNLILIGFVVLIVVLLGINLYSIKTAKTFCEERGLNYLDIYPRNTFDLKDDVICFTVNNNRIDFYYFGR